MRLKKYFKRIWIGFDRKETQKKNENLLSIVIYFFILLTISIIGKLLYVQNFKLYMKQFFDNTGFENNPQYFYEIIVISMIIILNLFVVGIITVFINQLFNLRLYSGYNNLSHKLIISWVIRSLTFLFLGLIYWLKLEFNDYEVKGIAFKIGLDLFIDIQSFPLFIKNIIIQLNIFYCFWAIVYFKMFFNNSVTSRKKKIFSYISFLIILIPIEVLLAMIIEKYLGV